MLFFNVVVRGHKLVSVQAQILASGSVGADCVHFEFDDEWVGLAKIALFWGEQEEPYAVTVDINSNALIPWEVLDDRRRIKFGVYGVTPGETTPRITSTLITVQVPEGAWSDSILNPGVITPTIIEQFVAEASAAISGSVRYDGPQSLTTAQIVQARENIDAANTHQVVRHDVAQSLDSTKKTTARSNIDAAGISQVVRHDVAQSLDSTEKTMARSNIDAAGISQVVRHDAAQSLSDGQKLQAQHNIGMNAGNMASEFSSSHNYEVGEFFTHGSYLYYVKENRSAGAWSDSDVDDTNGPFVHAAATSYIMRTAGITAKQFDPTEDYLKGEYFVYDYHLYQLTANFTHTGSFPTTGVRRAYLAEDVPQISVSGTTLVIS